MAQSCHRNPETHRCAAAMVTEGHGGPDQAAEYESSEPLPSDEEQKRPTTCSHTEDPGSNGSWSQSSLSRSLQRAEALLRTRFNPGLRWLLCGHSTEDEEVEGSFVAAHNLVSRSSERLLRLEQGILGLAPQWQLVGGHRMAASLQVCPRGPSQEGSVLHHPSSSTLGGHYGALWSLLEQRAQLLFVHEYARRARSATGFISRLNTLRRTHPDQNQNQPSFLSAVSLVPLSQELRVHLNHWSALCSKAWSDCYLRPLLAKRTHLLTEMRRTLGLLGLQALVLMESCVYTVLSALAQTRLESVPREVLEEILLGTELYNQAVEEYRAQHSATRWRTAVLQQADWPRQLVRPLNNRGRHPTSFPVKELMRILAIHQGKMAAEQLHHWASQQNCLHPTSHLHQGAYLRHGAHFLHQAQVHCENQLHQGAHSDGGAHLHCGASSPLVSGPEWTWDQLERAFPLLPPLQPPPYPHSRPSGPLPGPVLNQPTSVHPGPEPPNQGQTRANLSSQCQTNLVQTSPFQPSVEHSDPVKTHLNGPSPFQTSPKCLNPFQTNLSSPTPLPGFCQQDQRSVELLFQVLVSYTDLLAPLVPHTPRTDPVVLNLTDPVVPNRTRTEVTVPNRLRSEQDWVQDWDRMEPERTATLEHSPSPACVSEGEPEEEVRRPRSVQWLDLGQSSVCAELFGQYRTMLWTHCSRALQLHFCHPPPRGAVGSFNLWNDHMRFQLIQRLSHATEVDLVSEECRAMLEDCCLRLLVTTAHTHWDHILCSSLGTGLKDKCLPGSQSGRSGTVTSLERDGSVVMTGTMGRFLQLSPPLLSSIHRLHSADNMAPPGPTSHVSPSRLIVHRNAVSLALAWVQCCTVWVMSKAYQFLSSWSLNKFLLITQGDLKVLRVSVERLLQQTETLNMDVDNNLHHHHHHQMLLRQQIAALCKAVSELQVFSSMVLKIFSSDCKRMSGEIFEQTMPSHKHWRLSYKMDFPSSPSEYASLAAQSVIGQVLEGVAPLPDDARIQALSVTMTAFMEAWMEHILKQKIKFSIQGALQLKQDFDLIRELIQSEHYRLSGELLHRLLSLSVFQQVDSAIVCLLQQPQAKAYLHPRGWHPFSRCCPTTSSSSVDAAVGDSITNLESMDGEVLTTSGPSPLTSDLSTAAPTPPGEPYLAPSLALGAAQQEWLDLRITSSSTRWRLPGLQCLQRSEP